MSWTRLACAVVLVILVAYVSGCAGSPPPITYATEAAPEFQILMLHGRAPLLANLNFVGPYPTAEITPPELFAHFLRVGLGGERPAQGGRRYLVGRVEGRIYTIDEFEVLSTHGDDDTVTYKVRYTRVESWDGEPAPGEAYFKLDVTDLPPVATTVRIQFTEFLVLPTGARSRLAPRALKDVSASIVDDTSPPPKGAHAMQIHLQEGFDGSVVAVSLDGRQVWRGTPLTNQMLDLAAIIQTGSDRMDVTVGLHIPAHDLEVTQRIDLRLGPCVGLSLQDGKLVVLQAAKFAYD